MLQYLISQLVVTIRQVAEVAVDALIEQTIEQSQLPELSLDSVRLIDAATAHLLYFGFEGSKENGTKISTNVLFYRCFNTLKNETHEVTIA